MKRREFLGVTCLAAMGPVRRVSGGEGKADKPQREYYELKRYRLKSADKQKLVLDYFRGAAIPALNRIGIARVGVFKMLEGGSFDLYVLLVHNSLESVVAASGLIWSDAEYRKAAESFLNSPKSDAIYERIESSLMLAFEAIPKLEIPTTAASRIFQLRTYESHNSLAARKKIEMFNTGGEIAIFRRTGLNPVFFGESIIGSKLPNLTYMLGFEGIEKKDESWNKFLEHPEWKKLNSNPYYKDTVSNIANILLRPASCSQI